MRNLAEKTTAQPLTFTAGVQASETQSLDTLVARAKTSIRALLATGTPLCVAWSAGKDSSVTLNLVLTVAAEMGTRTPIVVMHSNTGVENPVMVAYAELEMEAVRAYARAHGLNVRVRVTGPQLSASWAVRIIGGRGLPTFANASSRDCTNDYKIKPMKRLRKRVLKELSTSATNPAVLVLGVRFDESVVRAARMTKAGDTDAVRFDAKHKERRLTPICYWSDDDVWEYLGSVRSGQRAGYSSFEQTFNVYADAGNSSCAVVADAVTQEMKQGRACSARHGCWACVAVSRDRSMENMLAANPEHGYMDGLARLRRFLINTQYDFDRRYWVGRTIRNEHIKIEPDTYSPAMMEELLRYCLTLDVQEQEAAMRLGLNKPRFQIITAEALIAIDATWSLQGHHRPFHALKLFRDIYLHGERYEIPEIQPFPKQPMPAPRFLYVGDDWDEGKPWAYSGLRQPELEAFGGAGCRGTRELSNGNIIMDVDTDAMFSVDLESAYLVLELELDDLLTRYHDNPEVSRTEGYRYYARMGTISLTPGQASENDKILRRTRFKERHGLAGDYDLQAIMTKTISREQWRAAVGEEAAAKATPKKTKKAKEAAKESGRQIGFTATPAEPYQGTLF